MSSTVPAGAHYASVSALNTTYQAIILFRILQGKPVQANEFDSFAKIGQRSRSPLIGAHLAQWGATSLYDMLDEARKVAQNMRATGRPVAGIAEVHLPTTGWFPMQQTGRNRHHWAVWGDTEHIARFIVGTHPASEVEHE
ncbi:MAG: hypothetical protein M3Y58_12485 [Chloroflexota bacterium]|nr:hypothetical protein [Chloroflexota bacterium]